MGRLKERVTTGVSVLALGAGLGAGLVGCGENSGGQTITGRLPGTFEPSKVLFVQDEGQTRGIAAGTGAVCIGTEMEVDGTLYGVPTDTEAIQRIMVVMKPGHEYTVKAVKGEVDCSLFNDDKGQMIAEQNIKDLAQEQSLKTYIAATITS